MRKFCPRCGKESEKLIEGFCERCLEELAPAPGLKDMKMEVCPVCSRVREKGRWVKKSLSEVIVKYLKRKGFRNVNVEVKDDSVEIEFDIEIRNKTVRRKSTFYIKTIKRICEECSKERTGYYEGVIQIRGDVNADKIVEEISGMVSKSGKRGWFISKIDKRKEGIDLYIGSKSAVKNIARRLKNKYNADVKESYTLVTRKDGRNVYRITAVVRF